MADRHASTIKRNRQNDKRRARNHSIISRVRTQIRFTREAIAGEDAGLAETELRKAIKELSKAGSKGVLHKNTVARRIGRLTRALHQAKSASAA